MRPIWIRKRRSATITKPSPVKTRSRCSANGLNWRTARRSRRQCHGAGHRRSGRLAQCAHGAAEGVRPRGVRLLHQYRIPEGRRTGGEHAGGSGLALEIAAPPGSLSGTVNRVSAEEADAYFVSRARASRIGAWASKQSRPLENRTALAKSVATEAARFGISDIPRPAFWTGFRIVPNCIEFWMDKPFRLHDRLVFKRSHSGEPWSALKLYP